MRKLVCPLVLAALAVACQKPASTPATSAAPAATAAKPATPPAKPIPAVLPEVIADCNGDKIPKAEFEGAVRSVEQRAGGPIPTEKRAEVYRGVLDDLVAYRLLETGGQAAPLDGHRRGRGGAHRRIQTADGHRGQLQGGAAGPADHRSEAARGRAHRSARQQVARPGSESEDSRETDGHRDLLREEPGSLPAGRDDARQPHPGAGAGRGQRPGADRAARPRGNRTQGGQVGSGLRQARAPVPRRTRARSGAATWGSSPRARWSRPSTRPPSRWRQAR